MLNDATLWALRCDAAKACDADLSRLCSAALWGSCAERAQAKRKLRTALAKAVQS